MDEASGSRVLREPRWLTVVDLLMLVVGFAPVLGLPKIHHLDDTVIHIGAQPIPEVPWQGYFLVLGEIVRKCGLILVPVIMARRLRYGGLPHPAEWLAILVALLWVPEGIERSGVTRNGYPHWGAANARVGLALLILGMSWRRLPDWARTALLVATATLGVELMLGSLLPMAKWRSFEAMALWLRPHVSPFVVWTAVAWTLDGLLLVIPFVLAEFAYRTGPRASWTWVAWAGASIGLLALAADVGSKVSPSSLGFEPAPDWSTRLVLLSLPMLVAGLASSVIVRWIGRTADRITSARPARGG